MNLDHKALLLVSLFIQSCAAPTGITDTGDITLAMNWGAGPPTKHVVVYELDVQVAFQDTKGDSKDTRNLAEYKASYIQTIDDHPEGLLVRQKNFKVLEPKNETDLDKDLIAKSQMQLALIKITALIFASRPDYIMSPNGEFVRFHEFGKFSEIQNTRLKDAIGRPVNELEQMFTSLLKPAMKEELLQVQITRDLQLIQDWDKLSLSRNKLVEKKLTPAYTNKDNTDYLAEGMVSFVGQHACNWKTKSGCVELKFNSNDKNLYDVKLVVEPDTLFPHSFRAKTEISVQTELDGIKVINNSTVQYIHTVERF